jgi:two-component system phosphate regulon sensor histidine kinase PhoR
MAIIFKKTYTFALVSTTYITLFSTGFLGLLLWFFGKFSLLICLVFALSMATFSFFVIQYRVEKFIYRRVKKIYDDVSFLESTTFINQPITTDMATLTKQVKKFATDKKLEIESLKVREEYRR